MNIIACINMGLTYTPENVRQSHIAAAERWGARYVEIWHSIGRWPAPHHFGVKTEFWRLPWPDGCRVCLIDGDAVIRDDCPSVFDLVPCGMVGGVLAIQSELDEKGVDMCRKEFDRVSGALPGYQCKPEEWINGGVLVFDMPGPMTHVWQQSDAATLRTSVIDASMEQIMLNGYLSLFGASVAVLPREFNMIGPDAWGPDGEMNGYICHPAPIARWRPNKRALLDAARWRVCADAVALTPAAG